MLLKPDNEICPYNVVMFSVDLGDERVICTIDNPGIEVRLFRDAVEPAFFTFDSVQHLRVQEYAGRECLVAERLGSDGGCVACLQLRPRVHISLKYAQ